LPHEKAAPLLPIHSPLHLYQPKTLLAPDHPKCNTFSRSANPLHTRIESPNPLPLSCHFRAHKSYIEAPNPSPPYPTFGAQYNSQCPAAPRPPTPYLHPTAAAYT